MIPEDDPSWPLCIENCRDYGDFRWCEHVSQWFRDGHDAENIEPLTRICVPVLPSRGVFAEVSIGEEILPGMAQLALVKTLPFTLDEELIDMGVWTEGEGRWTISTVLTDWAFNIKPSNCRNNAHGYDEQYQLERMPDNDALVNKWHLALDKCCMFCWKRIANVTGARTNFGLDGVEPPVRGGTRVNIQSSTPSGSHPTLDMLRQRYNRA